MAAIGLAQLERYDKLLNRRKEIINKYNNELLKCEKVSVLEHYNKNINSSGHLYLVRVKDINESKRNEIINFMANNGIFY